MMRRSFALFCLVLGLAGCAAPQSSHEPSSVGTAVVPAAQFHASARPVVTTPRAARPQPSDLGEVIPAGLTVLPAPPQPARPRPAILRTSRPLQCVPYARELSQIALRGNAWTWWQKAEGRYQRGNAPVPGSVMVLSKTQRLRAGHLAYVVEVLNSREILVHQANWLNRGQIHRYTPVRDVSEDNDWSVVRVWYTPGRVYGSRNYPAYGFIYPDPPSATEIRQASN